MGEPMFPKSIPHLHNREDKLSDTSMVVEKPTTPSVAQLAGKFQEQPSLSGKEIPAIKPTRRKPPCSLPLHVSKMELGQNGELKPSPNASHPIKVKTKSSPLIEKLQANLAFSPTSLLPGASPKSPGLKAVVSPFSSPPPTPISPQAPSDQLEESPVSFDQPPEGTHLQFYNKVRTRGSMKRRPPSRRFRKSQSEYGDDLDFEVAISSQENGSKDEKEEARIFTDKIKATKPSSSPMDGIDSQEKQNLIASDKKFLSYLGPNRTDNGEQELNSKTATEFKDSKEEKIYQNLPEEKPNETMNMDREKDPNLNTAKD